MIKSERRFRRLSITLSRENYRFLLSLSHSLSEQEERPISLAEALNYILDRAREGEVKEGGG